MTHPLQHLDDLTQVSQRAPDPDALTLCAIGRNEMYFLPAFFEHYRRLGVEQFAILNDRSDDGTKDFLLSQPDTLVFESNYSYGDRVSFPSDIAARVPNQRILYVWRTALFNRFAKRNWALQLDLDEFVHLPKGSKLRDVTEQLDNENAYLAYGAMLDVYPRSISDLASQVDDPEVDLSREWYFDGEPHLELREAAPPAPIHPGARARLYHTYQTTRLYEQLGYPVQRYRNWYHRMRETRFGTKIPFYNVIQKPILAKWPNGAYFTNSHGTTVNGSTRVLLPLQHFRFTGALYSKIETAIRENSYSDGSRDHHLLSDLLVRMQRRNGSFLYRQSMKVEGYEVFEAAGAAFGVSRPET